MNEIRVKRMVLAGLAMLVVWVVVEILVEQVIARVLLGQNPQEMWFQAIELKRLSGLNYVVNTAIAVVNCMLLIWLYASLRPMYGVGTRTALITSAFGIILGFSMFINLINLGVVPMRLGLMEAIFEAVEFPIAMIAGAAVYEGRERKDRANG